MGVHGVLNDAPSRGKGLHIALPQGIDYRLSKAVGGLQGQILYDQIRPVAPNHRDLEQVSTGVPEGLGPRVHVTHLIERYELPAVGEAVPG